MKVTTAKAVRSIARYNIWTVPLNTVKKFNWLAKQCGTMIIFESVSATAIADDIVIIHLSPFSQRIAKELPSAQYLDCELRSPL